MRKQRGLEQQDVADRAGISIDQVSRLERGENVGLWYVSVILSALMEDGYTIVEDEHALATGLLSDGAAIRYTNVLSDRIKEPAAHSTAVGESRLADKRRRHRAPGK